MLILMILVSVRRTEKRIHVLVLTYPVGMQVRLEGMRRGASEARNRELRSNGIALPVLDLVRTRIAVRLTSNMLAVEVVEC